MDEYLYAKVKMVEVDARKITFFLIVTKFLCDNNLISGKTAHQIIIAEGCFILFVIFACNGKHSKA